MKTILLIEDDAWLAELYTDVLKMASYRVVHATDAQQGLERLDEQSVDVIILDLLLPGHNGIALLQELRSYPDIAHIPIIIHSGIDPQASDIAPETWAAYGVAAYVLKGASRPKELVRTVRQVIA